MTCRNEGFQLAGLRLLRGSGWWFSAFGRGGMVQIILRGSIYTTIMELGPQNHNGDGLVGGFRT